MKSSEIYYSVGALLYCPANNQGIVNSLLNNKLGSKFSLALCLEDTIRDDCVETAENTMIDILNAISDEKIKNDFFLPKIFIRVREPEQISRILNNLGSAKGIVTGFIAPKFSLKNADEYIQKIIVINKQKENTYYLMPILESSDIINIQNRINILYALKDKLEAVAEYVLNIRVGGNDLCHAFGFRRNNNESIHNIKPISDIFSDIITVFGMSYIVSGAVWEYYSGNGWDTGLVAEIDQDRQNGFIGKTVIHPNQIPIVNKAYMVSQKDYDDAVSILDWNKNSDSLVCASTEKERMNEYNTHFNWAKKIVMLARVYGISEGVGKKIISNEIVSKIKVFQK